MKMNDQYFLKTLSNAMDVLSLFEEEATLTPAEIESHMKMNRTNLFRILYTLRHKGLLEVDPDTGKYQLGLKVIHLASLSFQRLNIKNLSHPILVKLRETLNETTHLVIMKNNLSTFVDKVQASTDIYMGSYIGWTAPLYCTASGKVLLSFYSDSYIKDYFQSTKIKQYTEKTLDQYEEFHENMEEIRKQRYSIDNEEMVEGLTCYAVPILGQEEKPLAAISVSGPTTRINKNKETIIKELFHSSNAITELIKKVQT
jgi:IclR family KDG regulon transcriptional repressor